MTVKIAAGFEYVRGFRYMFARLARIAIDRTHPCCRARIDLSIVDDNKMREINSSTRSIDAPTDVLSFPMISWPGPATKELWLMTDFSGDIFRGRVMLGDVVISIGLAERQAEEYGHSLRREMAFLFLHGVLHLLGYDHERERDARAMRAEEEAILSKLGIGRQHGKDN